MARTINEIEQSITERLSASFELSTSAAAEWRMWTHCVAYSIHLFEIVMDCFREEMDADVQREVAGSLAWYNEKCYGFQIGHKLLFSTDTGMLRYESDDEEARIVKIANVNTAEDGTLMFRVATMDDNGNIVPLTSDQMLGFRDYINAIKFAGTKTQVISTDADLVKYSIKVWYDPTTPAESVRLGVESALRDFRVAQRFGGVIYRHEMMTAITSVPGVVTAKIVSLHSKSTEDKNWQEIDTVSSLYAGYFDYEQDCCSIELKSIKDIE